MLTGLNIGLHVVMTVLLITVMIIYHLLLLVPVLWAEGLGVSEVVSLTHGSTKLLIHEETIPNTECAVPQCFVAIPLLILT